MDIATIIQGWSAWQQVAFALGALLIVSSLLATCILILCRTAQLIILGYPPVTETAVPDLEDDSPAPQDCDADDNATGVCLKREGCKTRVECEHTIMRHNEKVKGTQ